MKNQHYIVDVFDLINKSNTPVLSRYYDTTTTLKALKYFRGIKEIKRYMNRFERYSISVRANSLDLQYNQFTGYEK